MKTESVTYGVTLWQYQRSSSGQTSLVSIATETCEALSPLAAVYAVMERQRLAFVDRAEAALPHGAVLEWSRVLRKGFYDVAVWTGKAIPLCEEQIEAASAVHACLKVMQAHGVTYASRVAVRCPEGYIWRKEHVKMYVPGQEVSRV